MTLTADPPGAPSSRSAPTPGEVLRAAAGERRTADQAEARLLHLAAVWADLHPVTEDEEAARHVLEGSGPRVHAGQMMVAIAGPGTPEVAEFSIPELALALEMSTPAARRLVGEALELRHRLPVVWRRVMAGDLRVWRARRIAQLTQLLSFEAAAAVDAEVAPVAHEAGVIRVDSMVRAAHLRFAPEEAARRAAEQAELRHVRVDRNVSEAGTVRIDIETDLAHGRAFDGAVAAVASRLAQAGDTRSLDVRRAAAIGVLADPDAAVDLLSAQPVERRLESRRPQVVLYLHLTDAALVALAPGTLGRVRGAGHDPAPLLTETVRRRVLDWLGEAGGQDQRIKVTPVVDQRERIAVDAYEIPDRIAQLVRTRDEHCVFPHCEVPSTSCDLDHIEPFVPMDDGGPPGQTSTDNLAPLCRSHHRLKTFGGWSYRWARAQPSLKRSGSRAAGSP